MNKKKLIEKLEDAREQLEEVQDSTGHVGISLEVSAYIRDYLLGGPSDMADRYYDDPFYSFFQNASHDVHTAYPIKKMTMISAIDGYQRFLGADEKKKKKYEH